MYRRALMPALLIAAIAVVTACDDTTRSTPDATSETTTETPSPAPSFTPVPADPEGLLPGGRLGMTANGRPDAPWAVLDVPDGFSTIGGWVIFDEDPDGGGGVGYWTISEVVRNPCAGDPDPMVVGDTVADVAAAFGRQRLSRVTRPEKVTVDGYRGLLLEVRVPTSVDFAACPEYQVWESDPAGARHFGAPGEFDKLWILDYEGQVVVLTVTADRKTPQDALDRLTGMVESAELVART